MVARTPNHIEVLAAQSDISSQPEYLLSHNGELLVSSDLKVGKSVQFAPISVNQAGDNQIIAAVTNQSIKVLSVALVAGGTVNLKWRSATTDLSGAIPLIANSGFVLPASSPGQGNYLQTASGEALNINLSGGVQVSGHISYYEE